jgi:hypothetical protein
VCTLKLVLVTVAVELIAPVRRLGARVLTVTVRRSLNQQLLIGVTVERWSGERAYLKLRAASSGSCETVERHHTQRM